MIAVDHEPPNFDSRDGGIEALRRLEKRRLSLDVLDRTGEAGEAHVIGKHVMPVAAPLETPEVLLDRLPGAHTRSSSAARSNNRSSCVQPVSWLAARAASAKR